MARVQEAAPYREVIEGRPNQVLSISEVKTVAFRFTNSAGQVDVGLALCFGTDSTDGGPGVWVINPRQLQELIGQPMPHVKNGIRRLLNQAEAETGPETGEEELPEFGLEEKEG